MVLDLDAFQFEDMPVLDRVLEYWSGMSRRGFSPPPLVALASEPTQQLYLRKSKMFREYFEAAPAFSSSAATRALLNFDANTLGRRLGVEFPRVDRPGLRGSPEPDALRPTFHGAPGVGGGGDLGTGRPRAGRGGAASGNRGSGPSGIAVHGKSSAGSPFVGPP